MHLVLCALILYFSFLSSSEGCERPVFTRDRLVGEISESGFGINWEPVINAEHYTLKYILRIPEGRALMQREVIVTKPFHMLSEDELAQGQIHQLVVEVTAQCGALKSSPAVAQVTLASPAAGCRFSQQLPVLKNRELSWPSIKGAQSYMVCFHNNGNQPLCKEITDSARHIIPENTLLIGITPICSKVVGTPVFIANDSAGNAP
jgi:hypothetical protein